MAKVITDIISSSGKRYGSLVDRTLKKVIRFHEHILRKPEPSIGIDKKLYDRHRPDFDMLEVFCSDTQDTYTISADLFDTARREIEFGKHGKQYVVPLRRWQHTNIEARGQKTLSL